jgi:hypothetical protein
MLSSWLDHPAVQGGIAPLAVALVVAALLSGTRYAWLAVAAAYVTAVALSGDWQFDPLTAARKLVVTGLAFAALGVVFDAAAVQWARAPLVLAIAAGLASLWVLQSVLRQRTGTELVLTAGGVAVFVAVMVALVSRLRDDGIRAGAAGLALGLATGVAGVLSASIGYLLGGMSVAAASGALLFVQVVRGRAIAAGHTGTLSIAVLTALFAVATLLLAQLPWYALPLLALVPLAASLPLPDGRLARPATAAAYTVAAACVPIAAAWVAARGSLT